jgi:hypothetical protein
MWALTFHNRAWRARFRAIRSAASFPSAVFRQISCSGTRRREDLRHAERLAPKG